MVGVTYHTDSGAAGEEHLAGFTGRQFDYRVVSFTRSELSERTGGASHAGALSGTELDTMDQSTDGYLGQGKCVSHLGSHVLAAHHGLAYLKAVGRDDIGFGAVGVVQQGDACGAVGIILDALHHRGHPVVVSLEVDQTQFSLMAASTVTCGEMARRVAAACGALPDCKRLFWCGSSDLSFEHTNNLVSLPRRSGLEFSYCHFF